MHYARLTIIFLSLALTASCDGKSSKAYKAPIPCTASPTSGYCMVLDHVHVSEIGTTLQQHPKYWCPPKAPDPDDVYCDLTGGGQLSVTWFDTVPTIVKMHKVKGAISYVELLYTFNEFDRLAEPMQQKFGKPTSKQEVGYRDNVAPSRMYTWDLDSTRLQLFDNSASTSVQITLKAQGSGT